jgi:nucleotide-binding universal stress UspA family protein
MKILIPVDDSDMSRHAIEVAARMGQEASPTEAILLNVREQPEVYGEISPLDYAAIDRAQRERQQRVLAKALEHARRVGIQTASVQATQGFPADDIVRMAREQGVDHIVMGTHGRGVAGSVLMGSVAQRVVHLSPLPVTLVK